MHPCSCTSLQGEVIERGLIKSVTQMLGELGHAVYVEDFEKPFLAAAAEFYRVRQGGVWRRGGGLVRGGVER